MTVTLDATSTLGGRDAVFRRVFVPVNEPDVDQVLACMDALRPPEIVLCWAARPESARTPEGAVRLLLRGTERLRQAHERLERRGHRVRTLVLQAMPSSRIIIDAALRSRSTCLALPAGGTLARRLSRCSSMPVLAVPPACPARLRTILLPVRDREHRGALRLVEYLARLHAARVVLLHVYKRQEPCIPWDLRQSMNALAAAGVSVTAAFREGRPWREIGRAASAQAADLIVISVSAGTTLWRRIFGTTSARVLRATAVPVLLLPREAPLSA